MFPPESTSIDVLLEMPPLFCGGAIGVGVGMLVGGGVTVGDVRSPRKVLRVSACVAAATSVKKSMKTIAESVCVFVMCI